MDAVTRRRVCELIAGIIATDGELHPDELLFMVQTFAAFEVATGEDDEAVCPTTTSMEAAKLMGELPEDARAEALSLLMDSAVADGKVVPAEREYLLAVGRAAGVSRDDIDDKIAEALMKADPAF
jgi:uncharacterized tellurite resistance protein B-like protein